MIQYSYESSQWEETYETICKMFWCNYKCNKSSFQLSKLALSRKILMKATQKNTELFVSFSEELLPWPSGVQVSSLDASEWRFLLLHQHSTRNHRRPQNNATVMIQYSYENSQIGIIWEYLQTILMLL